MKTLSEYIKQGIDLGATDIHFCENEPVRARINTQMTPLDDGYPIRRGKLLEQVIALCDEEERERLIARFNSGNDIDFSFTIHASRIRANVFKTEKGVGASLRIIPHTPLTASQIGIPFAALDVCKASHGIFVITGASGSGKSTTLAALVEQINMSRKNHIITIEDPIEYLFTSKLSMISQREVGRHSPSFYDALRSALREDPDVIVLGEMRDLESTRIAMELAETGHLVFTTLHTRTAAATIDRIIGQFPAGDQPVIRSMLADNLLGVMTQDLLVKKRGGVIAAFELLLASPALRNLIREGKTYQISTIIQTSSKSGMFSKEDSLERLVAADTVSAEEALRVAPDREALLARLRSNPRIDLRNMYI